MISPWQILTYQRRPVSVSNHLSSIQLADTHFCVTLCPVSVPLLPCTLLWRCWGLLGVLSLLLGLSTSSSPPIHPSAYPHRDLRVASSWGWKSSLSPAVNHNLADSATVPPHSYDALSVVWTLSISELLEEFLDAANGNEELRTTYYTAYWCKQQNLPWYQPEKSPRVRAGAISRLIAAVKFSHHWIQASAASGLLR